MTDSVKFILLPSYTKEGWNVDEIKSKLEPFEKFHRIGFKPDGFIKNMAIWVNERKIVVEGSIAKYWQKNNVENFDWRNFRKAIDLLSYEMGVPLENGKIIRLDIGVNIGLNQEVVDYFPELLRLEYFQRNTARKTTLRYQGNSVGINYLLYDKLSEFRSREKLIDDDLSFLTDEKHLMRIEMQMQSRISEILGIKDVRIYDLFEEETCKHILRFWYDIYFDIEKEALLIYPERLKGLPGFDKFMRRYIVQTMGWERLDFLMKQGVKKKCIYSSDKSKRLALFKDAMLDNFSFEFEQHTKELSHKVKVAYVEGLKQIFRMKKKSVEKLVK
ncbi:hypothetical protein [Chryseobacterium sp. SIMBA_029]|uniref:hypothetical protein n=2 Tax=Bacteria TaxID=2 RepID=UPI00397904CB